MEEMKFFNTPTRERERGINRKKKIRTAARRWRVKRKRYNTLYTHNMETQRQTEGSVQIEKKTIEV